MHSHGQRSDFFIGNQTAGGLSLNWRAARLSYSVDQEKWAEVVTSFELAELAEKLCRLELEERQLLERVEALKRLPPGVRFPMVGDEADLLTADPLGPNSKWSKDLPKLVQTMLEQWQSEREFWVSTVSPLYLL